MITREDLENISIRTDDCYGSWNGYDLYYKGKKIASYPCGDRVHVVINEENYQRLEHDEKIDNVLKEMFPKTMLTDEQFAKAKEIVETGPTGIINAVKYIHEVLPDEGLKTAKAYVDLYLDNRNYD